MREGSVLKRYEICIQCYTVGSLWNAVFARGPFIPNNFYLSCRHLVIYVKLFLSLPPRGPPLPTGSIPFHRLKLFLCYLNSMDPPFFFQTFLLSSNQLLSCVQCSNTFRAVAPRGDRLSGLVVRVPGCRSKYLGFDSRRYQIF
jgi:hypothetical protein